jgi:hypothetical protein
MGEKKGSEIVKVVALCVLAIGLFSGAFLASTQLSMAASTRGSEASVRTMGTAIAFDQPSIVPDEVSLIPLSTVSEVFGASVGYDNDSQTLTLEAEGVVVVMQIGNSVYTRNGEQISLDVPPQVLGGRLMVPAHPLAESFGIDAGWEQSLLAAGSAAPGE